VRQLDCRADRGGTFFSSFVRIVFSVALISLDGSDGCGHTVLTECVLQVLEKEVEEEDGFQIGRDKLMACILNVSRTAARRGALRRCTTRTQRETAHHSGAEQCNDAG